MTDAGACTERAVDLRVAEGGDVTIFVICRAEHPLALRADITLAAGAHAKVVLLENPSHGATVRTEMRTTCAAGAKIEYLTILLGDGDLYADQHAELVGDGSALKADIAYFGRGTQTVDYNIVVNHFGKKTESVRRACRRGKEGLPRHDRLQARQRGFGRQRKRDRADARR